MVRRRGEKQDERDRSRDERRVVDVALGVVEGAELAGEADGEEKAEEHLGAWNERAKLFEQLAVLALELLLATLAVRHRLREPNRASCPSAS